jgi:hypothetical protein
MDDDSVRDQIAQLEERIERLSDSIERCRKVAVGAKIAVAAGALWFALMLLWILPFTATAFVAATTAVLGGFVLLGSNSTTWTQLETDRDVAETARVQMIGQIELRLVGPQPSTVH